jgi:cytochrome c oxidase subunit 1
MDNKPEIEMPAPSYWPIVMAASMAMIAIGLIDTYFVSIAGVILLLVSVAGWTLENRAADQEHEHE